MLCHVITPLLLLPIFLFAQWFSGARIQPIHDAHAVVERHQVVAITEVHHLLSGLAVSNTRINHVHQLALPSGARTGTPMSFASHCLPRHNQNPCLTSGT